MKAHYKDILERIPEEPKWFDEVGCPRWCDFSPDNTADIYAKECCLILIECQNCRKPFKVCMSWSTWSVVTGRRTAPMSEDVTQLGYGDPPNIECCAAGPTMTSVSRTILEFWQEDTNFSWTRRPDLEIDIHSDWDE